MAKRERRANGKDSFGSNSRKKTSGHTDHKRSYHRTAPPHGNNITNDGTLGASAALIQTEIEFFLLSLVRDGSIGRVITFIQTDMEAFLRNMVKQEVRSALGKSAHK